MIRYRLYSCGKLISYSQRCCSICSRFLNRKQKTFCSKHGEHNERNKVYNKSCKGKKTRLKYFASPKGKSVRRKYNRKYAQTEKGKEMRRRNSKRCYYRKKERGELNEGN